MKKYLTLVLAVISLISVNAQYTWVNKNPFTRGNIDGAGFVINGMGYLVGGIINYSPFTLTNQNWQYNPITDTWSQKANYPYKLGSGAFFSINGYGYQVGGIDTTLLYNSNNYMYDPVADTWTPKAAFPEAGLGGSFYFVINGIAYVSAGARNSNVHGVVTAYSYNPATDVWNSIASYPGNPSISLCSFAIDSFGYAGMGGDGNGDYYTDMHKYNPSTNTWSTIAPFPGKGRFANLSAFVVNGKAYVGTGQTPLNGSNSNVYCLGDYYVYDPVANTWSSAPRLQGPPRYGANAISFGDSAYLVGGYNQDGATFYNYVDEFRSGGLVCTSYDTIHTIVYDTTRTLVTDTLFITVNVGITPNNTTNILEVYPNPAHNQLYINTGNYASMPSYSLKITNPLGQTVFQSLVTQQLFSMNISTWTAGVYFLQILDPTSAIVETKEIVIH